MIQQLVMGKRTEDSFKLVVKIMRSYNEVLSVYSFDTNRISDECSVKKQMNTLRSRRTHGDHLGREPEIANDW